jgi:hypothetical protein
MKAGNKLPAFFEPRWPGSLWRARPGKGLEVVAISFCGGFGGGQSADYVIVSKNKKIYNLFVFRKRLIM